MSSSDERPKRVKKAAKKDIKASDTFSYSSEDDLDGWTAKDVYQSKRKRGKDNRNIREEKEKVMRLDDKNHQTKRKKKKRVKILEPEGSSSDSESVSDDETPDDSQVGRSGKKTVPKTSTKTNKKSLVKPPVKLKELVRRVCPLCFKMELTGNLTRHLRQVHEITDKEELSSLSFKASVEGRGGMRPVKFKYLPRYLQEHWKESYIRKVTNKFLNNYQLYLVKDSSDEEDQSDDSTLSDQLEDEILTDDEDQDQLQQNEEEKNEKKSAKVRILELPYPTMSLEKPLMKALHEVLKRKNRTEGQVQSFLTRAKRILGYAGITHTDDSSGYAALSDGERAVAYISDILGHKLKLSPSTIKSYALTLKDMVAYVQSEMFDHKSFKDEQIKNPKLEEDLKKCMRHINSALPQIIENVHLHNAANLISRDGEEADVRIWDCFLEEKKACFEASLLTLEKALDSEFVFFEKNPGLSDLRTPFNFVVGYIAVYHILKSAARPGEFSNCQLVELQNPKLTGNGEHIIHVALHKTGHSKMASILVKKDMWLNIQRYSNVVKRFRRKSIMGTVKRREVVLAFPYAGTQHFTVHTKVYHVLNDWCEKNNKPHFTANILRKVAETTVEQEEDSEKRIKVRNGLNHTAGTAGKYYKKIESKTVQGEKEAVESSINLSKGFSYVRKMEFDVNVYNGPLAREDFFELVKHKFCYSGLNIALYECYCINWLSKAEPIIIKEICAIENIENKEELEVVLETVLSAEHFLPRKADIARQIRQKFGTFYLSN